MSQQRRLFPRWACESAVNMCMCCSVCVREEMILSRGVFHGGGGVASKQDVKQDLFLGSGFGKFIISLQYQPLFSPRYCAMRSTRSAKLSANINLGAGIQ